MPAKVPNTHNSSQQSMWTTSEAQEFIASNGANIPADLACPISFELMTDPVRTEAGSVYQRVHIQRWLERNSTDPLTNLKLPQRTVKPHEGLHAATETFRTFILRQSPSHSRFFESPSDVDSLEVGASQSRGFFTRVWSAIVNDDSVSGEIDLANLVESQLLAEVDFYGALSELRPAMHGDINDDPTRMRSELRDAQARLQCLRRYARRFLNAGHKERFRDVLERMRNLRAYHSILDIRLARLAALGHDLCSVPIQDLMSTKRAFPRE